MLFWSLQQIQLFMLHVDLDHAALIFVISVFCRTKSDHYCTNSESAQAVQESKGEQDLSLCGQWILPRPCQCVLGDRRCRRR